MLVGLPFAGKTTLAKQLEKRLGFVRLGVDDVKFELGYGELGDDEVTDEVWEKIFGILDSRILEQLRSNQSVINEYAWVTREWRDRARKLATDIGIDTKVIFVDTPENIVRERWLQNRKTHERFDLPEAVFKEALQDFKRPETDEHIILYDPSMEFDEWVRVNF